MLPLVSVIMPVYNCETFVEESVQSVLKQTFQDYELLVIDDASTDSTIKIIEKFTDRRIKLIRKQKNSGYTDSLNYGIKVAKGEYIARMDGDDISSPSRFARQITFLKNNRDIVGCGTWFKVLNTGEIISPPISHEEIKIELLKQNAFGHPTVMLRKNFLIKHKLFYDRDFEPAEDYDLWTRIVSKGKLANIPEVLLVYRVHPHQVSQYRNMMQKKNADLCRTRMIGYLLDRPSEEQKLLIKEIISKTPISSIDNLKKRFLFLNYLIKINLERGTYIKDEFASFIENEKKITIRSFFIFRSNFSLKLLINFHAFTEGKSYLTRSETHKFFLKCILLEHKKKKLTTNSCF
jgi:glycosyltransferase involved in cell wall biosynthesis